MEETCVYWIRHPDHTDINTQGYVGITNNFDWRMYSHEVKQNKSYLTTAINKHGWDNLNKDVVYVFETRESALKEESLLRPSCGIGWNIAEGGVSGAGSKWFKENKESFSKSCREGQSKISSEDRKESHRKRFNTLGPDGRKAASMKAQEKMTPEVRRNAARKAVITKGPEGLKTARKKQSETMGVEGCKAWAKKVQDKMGPEGRKAARKKQSETMGVEGRKERARKANKTMGPGGRRALTKKAKETLGVEGRKEARRKQIETMGPEGLRRASMKAVETRRRNRELKLREQIK